MPPTDLAATWATIAQRALELPRTPADIWATIVSTADTGLRGTSYDTQGGRPAGDEYAPSYPDPTYMAVEARLTRPQRDDRRDLAPLNRASISFVTSVGDIVRICVGAPPPEDWDDAVKDAHLLHERGSIRAAVDLDMTDELRWPIRHAGDALDTIERIHDGHCAHLPDDHARIATHDGCLSHARIGDYSRPRVGRLHVCRTCRDLMVAKGLDAHAFHRDPDGWPPAPLLREHADMERTGKRQDYQRARSEWLGQQTIAEGA